MAGSRLAPAVLGAPSGAVQRAGIEGGCRGGSGQVALWPCVAVAMPCSAGERSASEAAAGPAPSYGAQRGAICPAKPCAVGGIALISSSSRSLCSPCSFGSARPCQAKLSLLRASPRAEAAAGHRGSERPRWGGEPGPEGTRAVGGRPELRRGAPETPQPTAGRGAGRRLPVPGAEASRGRAPPRRLWSRPQRRARRGGRGGGGPSEGLRARGWQRRAGRLRRALPEAPRFLPRERALRSRPAPAPPRPAGLGWARAPRRLLPRSSGSAGAASGLSRPGVVPALSVKAARVYAWCRCFSPRSCGPCGAGPCGAAGALAARRAALPRGTRCSMDGSPLRTGPSSRRT